MDLTGSNEMDADKVQWYLRHAYHHALSSPDPSTQVGALAVDMNGIICRAVNGPTDCIDMDWAALPRDERLLYFQHAEQAALHQAHRYGARVRTLVCTWAACADCAKAIVSCGVLTLVRHRRDDVPDRWGRSIEVADEILKAGGVEIVEHVGLLGGCPPILQDGKRWIP